MELPLNMLSVLKKRIAVPSLLAILVVATALAGCQRQDSDGGTKTIQVDGGSFVDVMPSVLNTMLQKKDFLLVNVHVPYAGEIAGTDLFIPYDRIEQNLTSLPKDKNARIVLYCVSGYMSAEAAQTLVKLGYADVWNLHGGMAQWRNDGYPLLPKGE